MKYKCLVCGQIIDNNEMCPYCGSDSSQIVPIDSQGKTGHYRCLVCGRETENGDYCPYCGSQRLYNLDSRKVEDTSSINIQNGEENSSDKPVEHQPYEHVHYENKNSFLFDRPIEATQAQPIFDEKENNDGEQEFGAPRIENDGESGDLNDTLETLYFKKYGEVLPLDSIENPDPNKVDELYKTALERGFKITPEEVANAFTLNEDNHVIENEFNNEDHKEVSFEETSSNNGENTDDEETAAPIQESPVYITQEGHEEPSESMNEENEEHHEENLESEEKPVEEEVNHEAPQENNVEEVHVKEEHVEEEKVEHNVLDKVTLRSNLYNSLNLLSLKHTDEVTLNLINLLKNKIHGEVIKDLDVSLEEEKVILSLEDLLKLGNLSEEERSLYKKYMTLLDVLFKQ